MTIKLGMVETAGAAETVTADETRAMRKARRGEENIVVEVVKGIEEMAPIAPCDCAGMDGIARAICLYRRMAGVGRG